MSSPTPTLVTTSLTKYFSGRGDVLAGCVIVPSGSAFRDVFLDGLGTEEDVLGAGDAVALEENSRDFESRVRRINETGGRLFKYFKEHPLVERVYHPHADGAGTFSKLLRPVESVGAGGLLSLDLPGGEAGAAAFYDALPVSKGPSLGNDFTLACPYTLLAHYEELDWAASCGVGRNLVRLSAGLEEFEDLRARLETAFRALREML